MSEKIIIHDISTNEIIEREPTKQELDRLEKVREDFTQYKNAVLAKSEARKSALIKLAALGLTEDEISAL